MKVKFWGVRGSIPTPITAERLDRKLEKILELAAEADISTPEKRKDFIKSLYTTETAVIGGNTACVQIVENNQNLIFDMGSGIRELGNHLLKLPENKESMNLHIFISHTHWDHIMGFPFFVPTYLSHSTLNFYSPHGKFKERLYYQQDFRFFPVGLDYMKSKKVFHDFTPDDTLDIEGIKISTIELHHPGKSFAFRVESKGHSIIYASDGEYNNISTRQFKQFVEFFRDADLLIFDAMYSFDQEIQRVDWGHSSAPVGIDLAIQANVKKVALTHHDPENDDFQIHKLFKTACEYKSRHYTDDNLEIILAQEGMELEY